MHFDATISLGNVLSLAVMIFTFYSFHIKNVERFAKLENKVSLMWRAFSKRFGVTDKEEEEQE